MKKNNAFCSICTVNYSAYAGTLNDSLKKVGHNEPHYVLIVDYDKKYKEIIEKFNFIPIYLHELKIPKIDELIKKYSAFELSNVLKPFFMEWLLNNKNIENLVYLDTDIYVYNKISEIFEYFKNNENISVAITPHLKEHNKISDYSIETLYAKAGLYNGGFYALKNNKDSLQFLSWHKSIMFNYGYNAPNIHMFVDQKILDFAPILFTYVGIYRNITYNVGHWNFYEHKLVYKEGVFFVGDKKLTFFHFSNLKVNKCDENKNLLFNIYLKNEPELKKISFNYLECLYKNDYEKIINIPYKYKNLYSIPPLSFIDPISSKVQELEFLNKELSLTKTELNLANLKINSITNELSTIYYSRGWKFVVFLRKMIDRLIPKESLRRKVISLVYNFSKKSVKFILKTKGTLLGYFLRFKNFFVKLKPRKKRKINLKSKKIVYVGHSYHDKTKSTAFLIDYLKEFFEVEVILDDSWNGKPFPDLSFIDESYLGVIFFQLLPQKNIIENIKNDNIIYFPMYDGVRHDYEFWNQQRGLKIMNFSKNLHDKIKKWGLESMYIQYFPKPDKFIPGETKEVFFWQRLSQINVNTIIKFFKNDNFKIHIHKAVDPGQEFIKPSTEDEKNFKITYSDWFKTREEMWNIIKQKGIYIAPREYEGIGMSFLEAMAMGKAVISVDNPTMNEYIIDGVNGYLFNLKNPKEIDLSNIKQVQKNAYEFMKKGYIEWENNKNKIIDFIKKE